MADNAIGVIELIRSKEIDEGQSVDFKSRVDLKNPESKSTLIQATVAFLNANAAHLYVGVREGKDKTFERFEPYTGSADETCRQLQLILQDGIDPKPIGIVVEPVPVDDGFILDIMIPDLRMRPYQAKATGAFHIRTGRLNTPIPRDKVLSMFTAFSEYQAAAVALMEREDEMVTARNPQMPSHAVTLHMAIVPSEHFEQDRTSFTGRDAPMQPSGWRHWHDAFHTFSGCQNGFETIQHDMNGQPICRLFVGDDWLVHSLVAYPFAAERSGRVTVSEFEDKLKNHLVQLEGFMEKQGIRGPFAVAMKVDGLQRDPKVAWLFPNTSSKQMRSAKWVEKLSDADLAEDFHRMVLTASRYGGY